MRSATQPNSIGTPSPIARDIQNVVTDAQELLKTVQSEGETKLAPTKVNMTEIFEHPANDELDFAEVRGQESVKRALEIAAAGLRKGRPWLGGAIALRCHSERQLLASSRYPELDIPCDERGDAMLVSSPSAAISYTSVWTGRRTWLQACPAAKAPHRGCRRAAWQI